MLIGNDSLRNHSAPWQYDFRWEVFSWIRKSLPMLNWHFLSVWSLREDDHKQTSGTPLCLSFTLDDTCYLCECLFSLLTYPTDDNVCSTQAQVCHGSSNLLAECQLGILIHSLQSSLSPPYALLRSQHVLLRGHWRNDTIRLFQPHHKQKLGKTPSALTPTQTKCKHVHG